MSKFVLRCVLLVSLGGTASAQVVQDLALTKSTAYQTEWQKVVSSNQIVRIRSVLGTSDGGIAVTGDMLEPGNQPSDLWLAKLDAAGSLIWQKLVGGKGPETSYAVKETSNGDLIIVGPSTVPSTPPLTQMLVVRISSQGSILWQRAIRSGTGNEFLYDVVYSEEDGGFVLVGRSDWDVWLVKLNGAGETEWSATYGTTHTEIGRAVSYTKDGGFIVAGTSDFPDNMGNVLVFKVDSTGKIVWQSEFAGNNFGLGNQQDRVYSIGRVLSDGMSCVVAADTARTAEGLSSDVVIKFNSDGTSPWRAYLGSPTETGSHGMSIAGTTDGGYLLGAQTSATPLPEEWVVKGSPSGDVEAGCGAVQVDHTSYGPGAINLTNTTVSVINTAPGDFHQHVGTAMFSDQSVGTGHLCEGASAWSRSYTGTQFSSAVLAVAETLDGGAVFAGDFGDQRLKLLTKLAPPRSAPEQAIYGGDSSDSLATNLGIATGNFNKDSSPDLLLGAAGADGVDNLRANSGEAYVTPSVLRDLDLGRTADASTRFRGASAGDALGFATAAGDLNGDGDADAILGAPGRDTGGTDAGEVDVFFASSTLAADIDLASVSPDVRITGSVAGGAVGSSLVLGDLNGDTHLDLAVGAPGNSASPGRVYVFYGPIAPGTYSTSAANVTVLGRDNGDALGTIVAIGNVNGTGGAQDLVTSAPTADGSGNAKANAGEVYVLFGGSLPATYNLATTAPSYEIIGADAGDQLGSSLAVGDVSGDGIADIASGARFADGNSNARADAGEAYVKLGSTTLSGTLNLASSSANVRLIGGHAGDNAGSALAIAEVNHQAPLDLILGAPGADGPTGTRTDAGEADVLLGPVTGLTLDLLTYRPSLAFHGVDASDRLGAFVAVGDVNGDGTADLLFAASGGDGPNDARSTAGEVYAVYGFCTPSASRCTSNDGSCTTLHIEMDSSCGVDCNACTSNAATALLFSNGGPEGAYCAADEAPCTGSGTCDGDTDEDGFVEGQYLFNNDCLSNIGGLSYELTVQGGPLCLNRKLLLRLSGPQQVCE